MRSAGTAFAPGNPANAGGQGVAEKAAAALKIGQSGMTLPPISAQSSSKSGDIMASLGLTQDFSGFSVNYSGIQSTGIIPQWVWLAGAAAVGVWLWKKR